MQRRERNESVIQLVQLVQIDVVEVAQLVHALTPELRVCALVTDGLRRAHKLNRTVIEEQRLVVVAARF